MRKVILIGGSPTAGKSHTARKLAECLNLPWISTDTVREQMRKLVERKNYPHLFHFDSPDDKLAEEYLTTHTAKQIVDNQNKESIDVWRGVKALIETDYVWGSFIVEGVAIIPHLVADSVRNNKEIKAMFLVDEDKERVRKTIFTRGLWDEAHKYPDSVKEKEIEWVFLFNEYIKKEAKKFGLPVISIGNRKDYFEEVKKIVKS